MTEATTTTGNYFVFIIFLYIIFAGEVEITYMLVVTSNRILIISYLDIKHFEKK